MTMMFLYTSVTLLMVISLVGGQTCNKIVTSNVGLTPTVGDVESRSKIVAQQYATLDADVVCAQEFWHEQDIIPVLKSSPSFQYHFSPLHERISQLQPDKPKRRWYEFWKPKDTPDKAACKKLETSFLLLVLTPCAFAKGCTGKSSQEESAECIINKCASILRKASEDCVSCIFQTVASSIGEALTKCHSFTMGRRYNAPGLLLLSKKRIVSATYTRLFTERMMLQRGYIEAEIEDVGTVVCTHLSSNLGRFYEYDMPRAITDYQVQQREEINRLDSAFANRPHILLGDLNTGPEIENDQDPEKDVEGEFAPNYAHLISFGYQAPYVTQVGKCTYCTDNPLIGGRYPNHIIDHVLFKGAGYTINSAERILDFTNPKPMSDHFGVRIEVCGDGS